MQADEGSRTSDAAPGRRWRRPLLLLLLVAAAAGGGIAWWLEIGHTLFFPKNWGVVEEGRIYRSGQIHRRLIEEVLREHEIGLVVDLSGLPADHPDAAREREVVRALGIRRVELSALSGDGTGDVDTYARAIEEIVGARRAGTPVLVHCAGGSERTGGVLACYRMLLEGWDGARAWDEYLRYRDEPPERDVLARFVNAHLADLAARLRARGLLDRVPEPLPRFGPGEP